MPPNKYKNITADGSSMWPLIKGGDTIFYQETTTLKSGTVYLYRRDDEKIICHRYFGTAKDNSLLFKGDCTVIFDPPVAQEQVIGQVAFICRGTDLYAVNEGYRAIIDKIASKRWAGWIIPLFYKSAGRLLKLLRHEF